MKVFKFELRDRVVITVSDEVGEVIARSDSLRASDQYLVRYKDATGKAVEQWWDADALEPAL